MKRTEKEILIEGLKKVSMEIAAIVEALEGEPESSLAKTDPSPAEQKEITYEELRALLAEKSRTGYRAEVKALLTSHGVEQLSLITDPAERAALYKEAEVIGNG